MDDKLPTSKQMGDAAEMLVAANLTLNGIPSFISPVNWPGYDVVAEPSPKRLIKISVKCRRISKIDFRPEKFDWLAIVLIDQKQYQCFIVPSKIATKNAKKKENGLHTINFTEVRAKFEKYQDSFALKTTPMRRKNPAVRMTTFGAQLRTGR